MREGWRNKGSHSAVLSVDEGGGQRCITSMVRNQNKKVTLACSRCCMQNTQTQSRLGPFDARGPQRNKTRSNSSVFHLLCTAFISLTRSSTSGITRAQTACKSVPLLLLQNGSRAQPVQTALKHKARPLCGQAAQTPLRS